MRMYYSFSQLLTHISWKETVFSQNCEPKLLWPNLRLLTHYTVYFALAVFSINYLGVLKSNCKKIKTAEFIALYL